MSENVDEKIVHGVEEDLRAWVKDNNLQPYLDKMVQHILKIKPDNIPQAMVDYLTEEYNLSGKSGSSESKEDDGQSLIAEEQALMIADDDDEDEDEDEDDLCDMPEIKRDKPNKGRDRRTSVSASSDYKFAQKKRVVHKKSPEDEKAIADSLEQIPLLKGLSKDQISQLVAAFAPSSAKEGEVIIKEHDKVAEFYFLIHKGTADVTKFSKDTDKDETVHSYKSGDAFGELALLYNQPRAATVTATSDMDLFKLDRDTFRDIVVTTSMEITKKRKNFLRKVHLLMEMNDKEISALADAAIPCSFKKDDKIIVKGEKGEDFFILEEGTIECFIGENVVATLNSGEYFGELALITDRPRQASVRVVSNDAVALRFPRKAFQRVFGPLTEILKRNANSYRNIVLGAKRFSIVS